MKKLFMIFLMITFMFLMSACYSSEKKLQEIQDMFNSFNHSSDYVLLTHFELVVSDKHYIRSDIKYNDKVQNIVFLEQEGYYSYTYDEDIFYVELLFTTYENFETKLLGTLNIPETIINASWFNNSFCFRMDDPEVKEFKPIYYCWNIMDKESYYLDTINGNEYSIDNNRNGDYSLKRNSKVFNNTLEITNKKTSIKKVIDISILDSFEEGKKIKSAHRKFSYTFDPLQVYIIENDFYFVSAIGADFLGDSHYHYILKWNFETEECSYISTIYFDHYQEWVDDFIILN